MKESQRAICVDPAPFAATERECIERSPPYALGETGHSLLLLQLRTELEVRGCPSKLISSGLLGRSWAVHQVVNMECVRLSGENFNKCILMLELS